MPRVKYPQVRFNLHNVKEPLRKTHIFAILNYRGKRFKYATGERVCPDGWDFERQRAKVSRKYLDGPDINDRLNRLEGLIIRIFRDSNFGDIEPAEFSKQLDVLMGFPVKYESDEPAVPTVFEFAKIFIESKKGKKGANSWKGYNTRINAFIKFVNEFHQGQITYNDVNDQFLAQFRKWLYEEPRKYRIGQAEAIIKKIREMMNAAGKSGYHTNSSYSGLKAVKGDRTKYALTFDELEYLYSFDFGPKEKLSLARDIFLVGCYTGQRFSDYSRIRPEHTKEIDGVTMIDILPEKTKAQSIKVTIPLLPIPLAILKKYEFAMPSRTNKTINKNLKIIGKLAGFTDNIKVTDNDGGVPYEKMVPKWELFTTHVARRSFATNFYRAGIPIAVLMKITGHKKESQFLDYIAIDGTENALHFAELVKNLK